MVWRTALITLIQHMAFVDLALGEYRAFELKITHTETNAERTVASNLDHIQYPEYYPLNAKEVISIADSWMCFGDTSNFTAVCAKPPRPIPDSTLRTTSP